MVTGSKLFNVSSQNQEKDALGAETHHQKIRVNVNNTAIIYSRETKGVWRDYKRINLSFKSIKLPPCESDLILIIQVLSHTHK